MHKPESVPENETYKILCDFQIEKIMKSLPEKLIVILWSSPFQHVVFMLLSFQCKKFYLPYNSCAGVFQWHLHFLILYQMILFVCLFGRLDV